MYLWGNCLQRWGSMEGYPWSLQNVFLQKVNTFYTVWQRENFIISKIFYGIQLKFSQIHLNSFHVQYRGTTVCDEILCPTPSCGNPIIQEGECCSTCAADIPPNGNAYCEFEGDGRRHLAGTKWHPYIPPWGFSRCAICTCLVSVLFNLYWIVYM